MTIFRAQPSPFVLLWLFAAAITALLMLLQTFDGYFVSRQQVQADARQLEEILVTVPHDNDLFNDTFQLDPAANVFSEITLLGLARSSTAYIARQRGAVSAVVLPAETLEGYNGSIKLLVGVTPEGEVTGVRIVAHNETPRLGDKIELAFSDWVLNFNKRSLDNTGPQLWRVKKDGGEFDQFAGATITPRAVVEAVRNALNFFTINQAALLNVVGTGTPQIESETRLIASPGLAGLLAAMMQPLPLLFLGLLLALRNLLLTRQRPPHTPPPATPAGSKRVRVTGKA